MGVSDESGAEHDDFRFSFVDDVREMKLSEFIALNELFRSNSKTYLNLSRFPS